MTVSMIIPAFNAGRFLDAALASVAAQSRPADEVVVIDDGSTDETGEIARRWSDHLPLVLVTKPENEGLGVARRDGIARSSGELLALLDADDYLLPDHLEVMLECHARHGGIVAAAGFRWVPERRVAKTPWNLIAAIPAEQDQPREILRRNFLFSNVVMERASYDAVGGFRDLRCDEDWDLWIRMIRNGCRVAVPGTCTVAFRNRPDSLSSGERYLAWDIVILEELLDQVTAEERPIVEQALRRRRARVRLLEGYAHARVGRAGAARWAMLRAALQDRSVRGGLDPAGSVTLRALMCAVAPAQMVERRDNRASREVRLG
ncbi:MAG TPA: glycosyltransferase family A protein [Acidimicrobiales bacterium]|nr:glycosyltransferase family A protein [Acidimicrobiales bacterium]